MIVRLVSFYFNPTIHAILHDVPACFFGRMRAIDDPSHCASAAQSHATPARLRGRLVDEVRGGRRGLEEQRRVALGVSLRLLARGLGKIEVILSVWFIMKLTIRSELAFILLARFLWFTTILFSSQNVFDVATVQSQSTLQGQIRSTRYAVACFAR